MGMQVGERKGSIADMNVVPLIDVLLVLLIIFMVIVPMTSQGLKTEIPVPSRPSNDKNVIVVQVSSDGGIKINGEVSSLEHLASRLQEIFLTRPEKVAFIKGDAKTDFYDVARAIDAIHAAGIDQVGLLTDQMQAGSGQIN